MIRRFGRPIEAARRYAPRPGVYVIARHGSALLTTWQSEPRPELQLPGGGIDAGEGPLQALHREVLEETGWRIAVPRRLGAYRRFTYMPKYDRWAEKICHLYLARATRPVTDPTEPGHVPLLLPAESVPEFLANEGEAHFLRRVLKRGLRA